MRPVLRNDERMVFFLNSCFRIVVMRAKNSTLENSASPDRTAASIASA